MLKVSGTFIADGSEIDINLGFVPDSFHAIAALGGTEVEYWWFKVLAEKATSGRYGVTYDGTSGLPVVCASAAAGFAEYDETAAAFELPAVDGDGYEKVAASSVSDFVAGTTDPTARSTSVVGTVVRPSTHNHFVYECTATAGVYGTEPTWPTTPGETVSDGTNTWICREERLTTIGGKGITVGADISTDSEIWVYEAELHDEVKDKGDSVLTNPI